MEEEKNKTLNIGSSEEKVTEEKPNKPLAVQKTENKPVVDDVNIVNEVIVKNALKTDMVKDVIDLASTKKALENGKTVQKLVDEKTAELINDATAKKIKAETDRIKEEVAKVKQEAEKEIAELDKIKSKLLGEVDELKARTDKAQEFFEANKSVLKCIGIKERLSLRAMQILMVPAGIVFALFSILLLPFTLLGYGLSEFMDIIDLVCGKVAKGGWKVALTIIVAIVIGALLVGVYFVITKWLVEIF